MADRILLLLVVAAASFLVPSSAVAAHPCHTFFVTYAANSATTSATVITVFRVRRLGPHLLRAQGLDAHPYPNHNHHHHLHSIPANIQIQRPELPHSAADNATGIQELVTDILAVVVGILFGIGCGALTAASMYLVWSVLAGPGASSHYDEEVFDPESPKKVGYVIIPGVDVHDSCKNQC